MIMTSLGEELHDPTHCAANGMPHLSPCIEPPLLPTSPDEEIRILLTGSRDWQDEDLIWNVLYRYMPPRGSLLHTVVLVHGDCPTGADSLVSTLWTANGGLEEPHSCDHECWTCHHWEHSWRDRGKRAGPIRNKVMVDLGAVICLAFPLGPLGVSRGTRGCMALAEEAGIPVVNLERAA